MLQQQPKKNQENLEMEGSSQEKKKAIDFAIIFYGDRDPPIAQGLARLDFSNSSSIAASISPSHLNSSTMAQEPNTMASETLPDAPAAPPAKQSVRSFKYASLRCLLADGRALANSVLLERNMRR